MDDTDIIWADAAELTAGARDGRLTVAQIAEAMIGRIRAVNPAINALVHFDEDRIHRDAAALDAKRASGRPLGAFFGVPYTHKELTPVAGVPHTLGFAFLKDCLAQHDAIVVERMRAADGLYLGQTNSSEGGYSAISHNRLFGATRNPWNLELSPGGSSGGAAAAVAAGIGPIAEGTDAGGSVRVPAAFSGVVGFKPTTGTIPHTLLPQRFVSNLSHGVLARSVADVVTTMDVCAGYDARDPLSRNGLGEPAGAGPEGWKIAYSPDLGFAEVDEEVAAICRSAVDAFTELGAEVVEATPDWERLQEAIWMGVCVPGFAGMRGALEWPSMRGQLADELIDLVLYGDDVTLAEVARGEALRGKVWDAFASFMTGHRLLISPTTTVAAFGAEAFAPDRYSGSSLRDRLFGWTLTHPFNMTTSPAISVPCGFTRDGRPVGLQIAGRMNADHDVLAAAAAFERVRPWRDRRPPI
ncbi:amidase family protein [Kineosporia sp. NBRC 101677]|uniref:amidase n=1 Tax=Kineosporia sp. NBRC 101677 TaxID=3032197 RepID=UPI0024A5494F|nr:amidase [Kineosporia sp. NBRC 101677]GLY16734.1 amidase family protein [Kineosporia sp. NBRC 101677]